jgi:hypothetical protein
MYVAITKDLERDVLYKLTDMRDAEMKNLQALAPYPFVGERIQHDAIANLLIDELWGEHVQYRQLLPSSWFKKPNSITMQTTYMYEGRYEQVLFHLCVPAGAIVPPDNSYYLTWTLTPDATGPWKEFRDNMQEWASAYLTTRSRYNKLEADIPRFLHSQKSLNAAVKALPELIHYLPASIRNKLEEKKPRVAKEKEVGDEPEFQIDRAALAVSAVASMLASK